MHINTSNISIEFRHHWLRHLQHCVPIAGLHSCFQGAQEVCWRRPVSCTPLPAGLHDAVPVRGRRMRSTNTKFCYSQTISYLKCLEKSSFSPSCEVLSMTLWNVQSHNDVWAWSCLPGCQLRVWEICFWNSIMEGKNLWILKEIMPSHKEMNLRSSLRMLCSFQRISYN